MENRILGFYKKEWKTHNLIPMVGTPDGTEYIHYVEDGIEYLTSGVHRWRINNSQDKASRYLSVLKKVDSINTVSMKEKLEEFYPYAWITKRIEREEKE